MPPDWRLRLGQQVSALTKAIRERRKTSPVSEAITDITKELK